MDVKEEFSICRLCLLDSDGLTDIFESNPAGGWPAAHLIQDLVQLQVSRDDGYPNLVCSACMSKLRAFKAFKKQCHTSKITFDNVYTFIKGRSKGKPPDKCSRNSKAGTNSDNVSNESSSRHDSTDGMDSHAVFIKTEDVSISEDEVDFGSLNTQNEHHQVPEDVCDSMEMMLEKDNPPGSFTEETEGQMTSDEQQSPSSFVKEEELKNDDSNFEESFTPFDVVQTSMEDQNQTQQSISSPVLFVTTTKGNRKLIYQGYAYVVDKSRYHQTYWRCDMRKCTGRAKTIRDVVQGEPSKHNHPPDDSRIIRLRYIHRVKQLAGATDVRPSAILETCAQDFPEVSAVVSIPKRDTLTKIIRRQRIYASPKSVSIENESNFPECDSKGETVKNGTHFGDSDAKKISIASWVTTEPSGS